VENVGPFLVFKESFSSHVQWYYIQAGCAFDDHICKLYNTIDCSKSDKGGTLKGGLCEVAKCFWQKESRGF